MFMFPIPPQEQWVAQVRLEVKIPIEFNIGKLERDDRNH